ncbi:hypothetical protein Celaphus_00001565, partial [Cervus elaphus hippelaphus]
IARHFRFGNQEDAHEFLRYTIDAMQKACLSGCAKYVLPSPQAASVDVHPGPLSVKCSICKSVSDTYDPYLDVALEIRQAANIVRALELFVKPDVLSGENAYMCAKCKKKVPASKRFTIHRTSNDVGYPEFLNIRPYMSQRSGEPVMYGLYAVLVHSGFSCHAGHYYCYVKVCDSGVGIRLPRGCCVCCLLAGGIPGSKKSPEGSISRTASSLASSPGMVPDHVRKNVSNGTAASPITGKRPDSAMMKKPQTPEELGVPIARNGSVSGLKSPNGYALPKPPLGSPSPKLFKTPTHAPAILDEPGKKVKKPASLQHFSPPPSTSAPGGSRSEDRRPGSWDGRAAVSTSPRAPAAGTPSGLGLQAGDEGPTPKGGCSSPEHPTSRPPQAPRSGATPLGDSQGTHSATAGPAKVLPARQDPEPEKAKCPVPSGTSPELANAMSPPPAKKLALSAKKASTLRRATGNDLRPPALSPSSDLTYTRKPTHPVAATTRPVSAMRAVSPAPRPSSHLKPPFDPRPPSLSSSPQPLGTSDPQSCSPASAPLPQVNGAFRAPPYQLPEASKPPQSLGKKRKKTHVEGGCVSETCMAVVALPGKRRKRKRKHTGDVDATPPQDERTPGPPWSPERRKEGRVEPLVDRTEKEGRHQPGSSQRLENGWPVGCMTNGPYVSSRKRRRKGLESCDGGDCLPGDPFWHGSSAPSDVVQPETVATSLRRKKKKKKKQEPQQEVEEKEPEGQRGPAVPGSTPLPAVNGQAPGGPTGLGPAPLASWDRERESDVVQELLKYSSDKAYGRRVLTWDGEVSAVSQDAIQDSTLARTATVIDDWDKEFDRGKEKKVKKFKREKKRNFNAFQKLQSRRNFWSVTHPAKASSLSYRR